MTELLKTLTNLRSLRVLFRELSLEQAEAILSKVQQVVEEKRTEDEDLKRAEIERLQRIEKYKNLIKQEGISEEELAEILGIKTNSKKRKPLPAKYQYVDKNGNKKTWTGQGRTPLAMQEKLDAGTPLSSFEI